MSEVVEHPDLISEIEEMKKRIFALEQKAPQEGQEFEFEVVASYAGLVEQNAPDG